MVMKEQIEEKLNILVEKKIEAKRRVKWATGNPAACELWMIYADKLEVQINVLKWILGQKDLLNITP